MKNFDQFTSTDFLKALYQLQQSAPTINEFTDEQVAKESFKMLSDATRIQDLSLIMVVQNAIKIKVNHFLIFSENNPTQLGFCIAKELPSKDFSYSLIFNEKFDETYFKQKFPEDATLHEQYLRAKKKVNGDPVNTELTLDALSHEPSQSKLDLKNCLKALYELSIEQPLKEFSLADLFHKIYPNLVKTNKLHDRISWILVGKSKTNLKSAFSYGLCSKSYQGKNKFKIVISPIFNNTNLDTLKNLGMEEILELYKNAEKVAKTNLSQALPTTQKSQEDNESQTQVVEIDIEDKIKEINCENTLMIMYKLKKMYPSRDTFEVQEFVDMKLPGKKIDYDQTTVRELTNIFNKYLNNLITQGFCQIKTLKTATNIYSLYTPALNLKEDDFKKICSETKAIYEFYLSVTSDQSETLVESMEKSKEIHSFNLQLKDCLIALYKLTSNNPNQGYSRNALLNEIFPGIDFGGDNKKNVTTHIGFLLELAKESAIKLGLCKAERTIQNGKTVLYSPIFHSDIISILSCRLGVTIEEIKWYELAEKATNLQAQSVNLENINAFIFISDPVAQIETANTIDEINCYLKCFNQMMDKIDFQHLLLLLYFLVEKYSMKSFKSQHLVDIILNYLPSIDKEAYAIQIFTNFFEVEAKKIKNFSIDFEKLPSVLGKAKSLKLPIFNNTKRTLNERLQFLLEKIIQLKFCSRNENKTASMKDTLQYSPVINSKLGIEDFAKLSSKNCLELYLHHLASEKEMEKPISTNKKWGASNKIGQALSNVVINTPNISIFNPQIISNAEIMTTLRSPIFATTDRNFESPAKKPRIDTVPEPSEQTASVFTINLTQKTPS